MAQDRYKDVKIIGNNKKPKILKDIEHVNFENLIRLNLTYNLIESIENLNSIKLRKLRQLELGITFF